VRRSTQCRGAAWRSAAVVAAAAAAVAAARASPGTEPERARVPAGWSIASTSREGAGASSESLAQPAGLRRHDHGAAPKVAPVHGFECPCFEVLGGVDFLVVFLDVAGLVDFLDVEDVVVASFFVVFALAFASAVL
jgi:hypothetical protein